MSATEGAATTDVPLGAGLTQNPQESSQIPSLFQTFGQNDASSGEDDEDMEIMEAPQLQQQHGAAYQPSPGTPGKTTTATTTSTAAGVSGRNDVSHNGVSVAFSTSRNRHPLSRSTHNPYALVSNTDGSNYVFEASFSTPLGNPESHMHHHRHPSCSNSTSQNPLMFEFSTYATNGATFNSSASSLGASAANTLGPRRPTSEVLHPPSGVGGSGGGNVAAMATGAPPSSQQPSQSSELANGFWRDGNRMSLSATDVRPTITTVGTVSAPSDDAALNINVNLRQRVRRNGSSRTNSLNTSYNTVPPPAGLPGTVETPLGREEGPGGAAAAWPGALGPSSSTGTSRGEASATLLGAVAKNGSDNASGSAISSNKNRFISVPPSSAVVPPSSVTPHERHATAGGRPHTARTDKNAAGAAARALAAQVPPAMPQPPSPPQPLTQQQYYSFARPAAVPTLQNTYTPAGYAGALPYGSVPQAAAMGILPPPQPNSTSLAQQPYYGTLTSQNVAMMQVAAAATAAGYMNPYTPVPAPSNVYMAGYLPGMMNAYPYQTVAMMAPYGNVTPTAPMPTTASTMRRAEDFRMRRAAGRAQQQRQQVHHTNGFPQQQPRRPHVSPSPSAEGVTPANAMMPSSAGSNAGFNLATVAGKCKNIKGKVPTAGPDGKALPGMKAAAAVVGKDGRPHTPGPSSADARSMSPPFAQAAVALSPSAPSTNTNNNGASGAASKKLPKRQDEARFHASHTTPIKLFVVVKRKLEGQRYACPLAAEDVPVGSFMLVEGDRGADIGEVRGHVTMEQMAHDCAVVEHRRKVALDKLQEQKSNGTTTAMAKVVAEKEDSSDFTVPERRGAEAYHHVMSLKDWPWVIGPATGEDMESIAPQREAEKQAFATAGPIVQQFVENRYQQRSTRNEHGAATKSGSSKPAGPDAEDDAHEQQSESGKYHAGDGDGDGDGGGGVVSMTEDELHTLELSRQVKLVDCEYQFTREKITLYVSRPARSIFVDFRRMQRKLFRTFRCRIWIAYMDEVADDEDAPESFVFVPPPSTSVAAANAENDNQNAAL